MLGLVIWILISPVMAFVIPSEIGKMYRKDGQEPPVSGWTGLWLFPGGILIIPAIVWFVKVQGALNRYWEGEGRDRGLDRSGSGNATRRARSAREARPRA